MKRVKLFLAFGVLAAVMLTSTSCNFFKGFIVLEAQRLGWEPGKPVMIKATENLFIPDAGSVFQWQIEVRDRDGKTIDDLELIEGVIKPKNVSLKREAIVYLPYIEEFTITVKASISGTDSNGKHREYVANITKYVKAVDDVLVEVIENDTNFAIPDVWFESFVDGSRSTSSRTPVYYKFNSSTNYTSYHQRLAWGVYPRTDSGIEDAETVFNGDQFKKVNYSSHLSVLSELDEKFSSAGIGGTPFPMRVKPLDISPSNFADGWRVKNWSVLLYVEKHVFDDPNTQVFLVRANRDNYKVISVHDIRSDFSPSNNTEYHLNKTTIPVEAWLFENDYGTLWSENIYFAVVVMNYDSVAPTPQADPDTYVIKAAEMVW